MENILVIAAHPDDEVLGCGATMAKLASKNKNINVVFICDGESSRKNIKSKITQNRIINRKKAAIKACSILGANKPLFGKFLDNQIDTVSLLDVVKFIEKVVDKFKPDTIFTHYGDDLNIDHSVVNKAVITACRPQRHLKLKNLLFFEIPSSTEWFFSETAVTFSPNWFEDISNFLKIKINALECYGKEIKLWPHPRSIEGVKVLAKYRGSIVGYNAAEAFTLGYKR
tara:strand:- start:41336 stop:42016 length:681 start_codon:yes stop_codon:yes gene_type:complete